MAFTQVPQNQGFHQVHPERQGFQQLHDSNNPAAQAYARAALARNGIQVPPGADAAALWRQFSQQRALQQNAAQMQGGDSPPIGPDGGHGTPNIPYGVQPPQMGPDDLQTRLPNGGYRGAVGHDALDGGLANNHDWRNRIAQMASALSSANTTHRLANNEGFQHNQGGPAESALGLRRIAHVNEAHTAARNLASLLTHKKPSRQFRTPRAY